MLSVCILPAPYLCSFPIFHKALPYKPPTNETLPQLYPELDLILQRETAGFDGLGQVLFRRLFVFLVVQPLAAQEFVHRNTKQFAHDQKGVCRWQVIARLPTRYRLIRHADLLSKLLLGQPLLFS